MDKSKKQKKKIIESDSDDETNKSTKKVVSKKSDNSDEEKKSKKNPPKKKTIQKKQSDSSSESENEIVISSEEEPKKRRLHKDDDVELVIKTTKSLELSDDDFLFGSSASSSKNETTSNKITKTKFKSKLNFTIDANKYKFESWPEYFEDGIVNIATLIKNKAWLQFINQEKEEEYFSNINKLLTNMVIKESKNIIVPYPDLMFLPENILSPESIHVVIIGQDPYINSQEFNNVLVPQAMGISFSAPLNYPKPESLKNIYKNLYDFKHITTIPESGYLIPWVEQGVLMINSARTTFLGNSNVHQKLWENFTIAQLKYINETCKKVVFLVWGKDALNKVRFINKKKHNLIISSHPSPLSFSGKMTGRDKDGNTIVYPSFKETDHFGTANKMLINNEKQPINWNAINDI